MKRFSTKDWIGFILIVGAVLAMAVTLVVHERLDERHRRRDREDRDPTISNITRSTVVLLDLTDPLGEAQAGGVAERLHVLEEFELERGEVVGLWTVGKYADADARCWLRAKYPGRAANPLIQTPRRIEARCDSLFSRPLSRALTAALGPARADQSEVTASIREITELEEFGPTIASRRLIIASDLMENTNELSFYRTKARFGMTLSPGWLRDHRADLRGVVVEVLEVSRAGVSVADRSALRAFWRQYFTACGASSVRFRRL